MIKNLTSKKCLGSEDFNDEFYQVFKEELKPILFKFFQKMDDIEIQLNAFYEA